MIPNLSLSFITHLPLNSNTADLWFLVLLHMIVLKILHSCCVMSNHDHCLRIPISISGNQYLGFELSLSLIIVNTGVGIYSASSVISTGVFICIMYLSFLMYRFLLLWLHQFDKFSIVFYFTTASLNKVEQFF